jgi:ribosome modulation factor
MNRTQLTTRSAWLAGQLRTEASRWSGAKRRDLIGAALQLGYQARVRALDPEVAESVIEAGITLLVVAMSARAFEVSNA